MKRSIFVFVGAAMTLPAFAQSRPVSDSTVYSQEKEVKTLQEVVVSVQKRNQSSLEVPVAVSALSGTDLLKLDVRQFDELSEYIPGMQMQLQSPNNPSNSARCIIVSINTACRCNCKVRTIRGMLSGA